MPEPFKNAQGDSYGLSMKELEESITVYDQEYFCLTDNNILLVKRDNQYLQITPSEFLPNDLIPSIDSNGEIVWVRAKLSSHIVPAGEKLVRVVSQGGVFELTTGHKLFSANKETVAAGNLRKKDKLLSTSKVIVSETKPISVELSYVLGAYAAEGSSQSGVCKSHNTGKWRIVFGLHHDEISFANKIKANLMHVIPDYEPYIDAYPEYTRRTVSVYNKDFVEFLDKLGALGYCWEKRTPSLIFTATKEEKAAYLAALFEGDSGYKRSAITLKLTSKALVDGAAVLLHDLGINSRCDLEARVKETEHNTYKVIVSGKYDIRQFLEKCGNFLEGWKHLDSIIQYANSSDGNSVYCKSDIDPLIKQHCSISQKQFKKITGISQNVIHRIYGSWNQALLDNGIKPNPGGRPLENIKVEDKNINRNVRDQIVRTEFFSHNVDTIVYDFTVPSYENFLLNWIVSHNSGVQAAVYFGDIWVDDISGMQVEVMRSKTPIYGYASTFFDAVSDGHVLVRGTFSINFKESGYLFLALDTYKDRMAGNPTINGPYRGGTSPNKPSQGNVEAYYNQENAANALPSTGPSPQLTKQMQSLADFATDAQAGNKGLDKFEDAAEDFEDIFWRSKNNQFGGPNSVNNSQRNVMDPALDKYDIFVVFGDYTNPLANHTTRKIHEVHMLGSQMVVAPTGEPLQEVYSFFAKNYI